MDRRTWIQLLGVLSAAGVSAQDRPPATPAPPAPQRPPQRPMRVTKEQVAAAFVLLGIEFQDSELDMMLRRVNDALSGYEELRKVDVPYDAEPAFAFHPGLPSRVPGKGPARYATTIPIATTAKAPKNLEDLAFLPVTGLAPLVRSRAVTSTELTKMYLGRMNRYSPNLLCLVTLTEALALDGAAALGGGSLSGRAFPTAAPRSSNVCTGPAPSRWRSSPWARWPWATCGTRGRPRAPGVGAKLPKATRAGRVALRRAPRRPPRRAW